MSTFVSSLPQPLSALRALAQAEDDEDKRVRLSQVSWFTDVLRFTASAIPRVYRPVLGITIWASIVAVSDLVYEKELGLSNNVVPLLSVVVGLLLVFRNSTAYARWQEGRQLFSNMANGVRSLARTSWCSIGGAVYQAGRINSHGVTVPYQTGEYGPNEKKEKVAALRMLVAFVIASKHHVRAEWGTDYEDLQALLPRAFLERFQRSGFGYGSLEAARPQASNTTLQPKASASSLGTIPEDPSIRPNGHSTGDETSPLLVQGSEFDEQTLVHSLKGRPTLPLPLVIAHRLQLYLAKCKAQGLLESVGPAGYNAMTQILNDLVSDFTGMERLLTLPLPTIYGVHLKQTVTLYLAVLPLVLVDTMSWKMIPFVTLVAFTLMGVEGIASEIEEPFGTDQSDLPLDYMCAELRNEIEQMIARLKEAPEEGQLFI